MLLDLQIGCLHHLIKNKIFMNRIVALVYWVFKTDKKQDTPYFATCLIVTLLLVINFVSIASVFNLKYHPFAIKFSENQRISDWVNTIIQGSLLWIIFALIFPKKNLEPYGFTEVELKKARNRLIVAIVLSIILMVCLLIKRGIDKGLIK